jgi:hypothetical protein
MDLWDGGALSLYSVCSCFSICSVSNSHEVLEGSTRERHGPRTKGPKLIPALASVIRWFRIEQSDGISFHLRYESNLMEWLLFGPSYSDFSAA